MGPILILFVLLHAFASIWQRSRQPATTVHSRDISIHLFVRIAIAAKQFVVLPAIVVALVMYSIDASWPWWFRISLLDVSWLRISGLALVIASIALRVYAYSALGANWSAIPTIYHGHVLIQRGPYRWVRHPVYTSTILVVLGTWVATGSLTLLALGCLYFATDAVRAHEEEEKLIHQFGAEYTRYALKVGKYVPLAVTFTCVGIVIACNVMGILDEIFCTLTGSSVLLYVVSRLMS